MVLKRKKRPGKDRPYRCAKSSRGAERTRLTISRGKRVRAGADLDCGLLGTQSPAWSAGVGGQGVGADYRSKKRDTIEKVSGQGEGCVVATQWFRNRAWPVGKGQAIVYPANTLRSETDQIREKTLFRTQNECA